jgi:hypothetical protein
MPPAPAKPVANTATSKPRVAVVGGGIAGITCALKLVKSGCHVTLYEATDELGGNLSSSGHPSGRFQDVYPHIFPDWYANFWSLIEGELGLKRSEDFAPRWGVKVLDKSPSGPSATEPPAYMDLVYTPTLQSVITTMNSGVVSVPDLFLFAFLTLDLAAQPPDPTDTDMLCQLDVNGFFYSRNYSTDAIAALQNYITSAKVYKQFIKHQLSSLGPKVPYAWMLRGSLQEKVIGPLEQTLLRSGDCDIRTGMKVRAVEVLADGSPRIRFDPSAVKTSAAPAQDPQADYVVMATPGPVLGEIVMNGKEGLRLVDKVPDLSQIRRTWGEAIPVVNLYFKRKLPSIPEEIVGLRGSGYDLTILDISQLWDHPPGEPDVTVLVVAASNAYAIPTVEPREQAYMMIERLREYIWFDLGEAWGKGDDIDWERTVIRRNMDRLLFVNDVGSRLWRPKASYPGLTNVFFAGDVCQTDVDMATVEAAVQSGVLAARAVQQAEMADHAQRRMTADPIKLAPHKVFSDATFLAAKLALLPFAYGASAWSALRGVQQAPQQPGAGPPAYAPDKRALLLPLDYTVDWWRTVYWLLRALQKGARDGTIDGVDPADTPVGLGIKGIWASGQSSLDQAAPASSTPAQPQGQAKRPMTRSVLAAAGVFASQLGQMLQAAADKAPRDA